MRSIRISELGQKIDGGGEGSIRTLKGHPEVLVKVWHHPTEELGQKVSAMITDQRVHLRKCCAWPDGLVIGDRDLITGFSMRRALGDKWFKLAGVGTRLQDFPKVDYRFLVGCSANLARAIGLLHSEGIVIGDINESCPFVAKDGTVTLIDCDSFQYQANGRLFGCEVAKPEFQPPELQGVDVRGIRRNANHDRFGLAVLVFQMLMLGKHPFSGVPVSGDLPEPGETIRRQMYSYARPAGSRGLWPPPLALPIDSLGAECVGMFDSAFGNGERPTAVAWANALDRLMLALRRCTVNPAHWFVLPSCPLCAIEAQSGRELFVPPQRSTDFGGFSGIPDVDALWRLIDKVRPPSPPDRLPAVWTAPIRSSGQSWREVAGWVQAGAVFITAVVLSVKVGNGVPIMIGLFGAALAANIGAEKRRAAGRRFKDAVRRRDDLVAQWQRAAAGELFSEVRSKLIAAHDELKSLPNAYRAARHNAENTRQADQLQEHLVRHRIDKASINGIGHGRASTLRSFGIETAADITRASVMAVPGFGPTLTRSLLTFRAGVERTFVFDPRKAVSPAKIRKIDQEFMSRQGKLVALLRAGPNELQAAARRCVADCERLEGELREAFRAAAAI